LADIQKVKYQLVSSLK